MEAPTPRRAASSDLLKGRDATQIEELKKLIVSEKQRAKAGGDAGSASGSEDEADGDELSKAAKNKKKALEALEAAKKVKPKGVWRKGKFIAAEDLEEGRYRDRAQERRTGDNPDYDGEIEKMVEVDAEKSKYLGGDLKHTHLVRGLDYALLLKVKEEARRKEEEDRAAREALELQAGNLQSQQQAAEADAVWHPPTIRTYTGKALYAAMQTVAKLKAPDFSRIAYEFDLSDDAITVVPTMLTRSTAAAGAADAADDDEITTVNYIMEDELLARMQDSLEQFRLHGKPGRRRKRKLSSGTSAGDHDIDDDDAVSVTSSSTASSVYSRAQQRHRAAHDSISLFDDDVGTYVPPEAAVPSTAAHTATAAKFVPPLPPPVPVHSSSSTSSSSSSFQPPLPIEQPPLPPLPPTDYIGTSSSSSSSGYAQPPLPAPPLPQEAPVAAAAVAVMPAGGVFSGLRVAHTSSKSAAAAAMDIDDDSHITGEVAAPSKEEISRSIRAAAAAAKRSSSSSTAAATAAAAVNAADAGKIDRDIFGGTNRGNGHSLAQGTYDVFPETAEYADAGESDSEGEGTSGKAHSKLGEQLSKKAEKGSSRAAAAGSSSSKDAISSNKASASRDSSSSGGKDNRRERRKRKAEDSAAV
jgi:RED-like protein N-terminal region